MASIKHTQKAVIDLTNIIRKSLNETKIDVALATITETANNPECRSSLSDIIPIITAHINEDIQKEKPKLFGCSEKILDAIAEKFEAEEVLLQLIEDVEKACDDTAFLSFLKPLQIVLLRLPKKRLNSLGWGLNAIHSYLDDLPLPENLNLEEDEEILMDANPIVEKISILYVAILPFYDVLIKDLKTHDIMVGDRKIILLKFMLQLLGKPLAFLDLKSNEKSKSRGRRVAEMLVEKILNLSPDIFWFLELQTSRSAYDIGQIDNLSLGVLYYLVLVEEVSIEKIPKVYDRLYIFQNALRLSAELLKYDNQFMIHNGLQLAQVLINNIRGLTLSYQLLDSDHHSEFCKALTNIIIYNQIERYRKNGLVIFQRYLFHFEPRGRFLLIYNLMKILNHTGIIGYIVTQYKDMLMEEFHKPEISTYFSGPKLFTLLNKFSFLHKGEESDLVELADQIVATLNLLRFLAIRDKKNITKVWDYFKLLEKSYLEPLKKGLIMSRAHYELKIKELKAESAQGDKSDSEVSVTVAGQQLSELPTNEKLRVLYSAITSFDVIESLLSRVNELIELGPTVVN